MVTRTEIVDALTRSRGRTEVLTDCVDEADLVAQHSPLMSPLVWDLAHIGNQEDLWLVRTVGGRPPVLFGLDHLYDAFEHPRANRPSLPLLTPAQTRYYVRAVREVAWDVLDQHPLGGDQLTDQGFVFGMIAQHEQQHDETMLATHQLRSGEPVLVGVATPDAAVGELPQDVVIPAGVFEMGTSTEPWALDNERPAHLVDVPAFAMDTFPVTNEQYLAFMADDGYRRRELWSERGWRLVEQEKLVAPQFWEQDGSSWWRRQFGRVEPLRMAEPVVHVSYFEADAYARWAGKRLPTESEWEKAARWDGRSRRFPWGDSDPAERHANLGQRHLRPAVVGAYPEGASPLGVHQLIGDVWEWTSSDFVPYPGFSAFPYREYSQVFFGGDYKVLRGGSFGTDAVACRGTFRNWDHPIRRQIFAGFRCVRDVGE